jgi:hypothetical protein
VVVVEPIYELADKRAQARMEQHGYVRGLNATAETLGCIVDDYRFLGSIGHENSEVNPNGVLALKKKN